MSETTKPSLNHFRAKKAHAVRYGDEAAAGAADRDLRAAKLEKHIRELVDAAPPLTAEQRLKLTALLTGGAA